MRDFNLSFYFYFLRKKWKMKKDTQIKIIYKKTPKIKILPSDYRFLLYSLQKWQEIEKNKRN